MKNKTFRAANTLLAFFGFFYFWMSIYTTNPLGFDFVGNILISGISVFGYILIWSDFFKNE